MQLNLEKDTIMMQTLYKFRYSHKVIDKFKFPVNYVQVLFQKCMRIRS